MKSILAFINTNRGRRIFNWDLESIAKQEGEFIPLSISNMLSDIYFLTLSHLESLFMKMNDHNLKLIDKAKMIEPRQTGQ